MRLPLLFLFLLASLSAAAQLQTINTGSPGSTAREAYTIVNENDAYLDARIDSVADGSGVDLSSVGVIRSEDFASNLNAFKTNLDIIGQGTVTLTNGSATVTGVGTNFLDATAGAGMSYWYSFHITDASGDIYRVTLATITSNTSATIDRVHSEADILRGYSTSSATFPGVTGTYEYKIVTNYAKDLYAFSWGNRSYSRDYGTAFGGSTTASGQTSFATGFNTLASGNISFTQGIYTTASGYASLALGENTLAAGGRSFAGGYGSYANFTEKRVRAGGTGAFNWSMNSTGQTVGHGANAQASAILGGFDHNIPSSSVQSVIIGGQAIKAPTSTVNTVFMPKVRIGLGTGGALTTDNTNGNFLVRDATTGEVEIRDVSSLPSGTTETASNGLTKTGNDIQLGGTITAPTTITDGQGLSIIADVDFITNFGSLTIGGSQEGVLQKYFSIGGTDVYFYDNTGSGSGLLYGGDYTTGLQDLSLVPKKYVLGAKTFTGKQTFAPTATTAGLNVGSISGNPTTLTNGDLWYDVTGNRFKAVAGGAAMELISGAIDGGEVAFGLGTGRVTTDNELLYNSTSNTLTTGALTLSATPTNNETASQILARNPTTGALEYRSAASLAGGGGGGITNSAAATELMQSDGTNAVGSGVKMTAPYEMTIGDPTTQQTVILQNATSSSADFKIIHNTEAAGALSLESAANISLHPSNDVNIYLADGPFSEALIRADRTSTNTVDNLFGLLRTSTGTPAVGIGASLEFSIEANASRSAEDAGAITVVSTGVTEGAESFDMVLGVKGASESVQAEKFRVKSTGVINIPTAPATDNAEDLVLVRDAVTGDIEQRSAATISGITMESAPGTTTYTMGSDATSQSVTLTNGTSGYGDFNIQHTNSGPGAMNITSATSAINIIASSGINITANSSNATTISATISSTNTVAEAAEVRRVTSGTPAVGIGARLQFGVEANTSASSESAASIDAVSTAVAEGTESFDLAFNTMNAGAAQAEKFRIRSTGALAITTTPVTDNTEDLVLVRDAATGNIEGRSAATIGGAGGASWGSITGTLSSQTDLQTALNAKADDSEITTINATLAALPTFLSASATLDFPSTGATAVNTLTISVPGAVVGNPCTVGAPAGSVTATGSYWCWVSAADVVSVRLDTNATENPASGTFTVVVTQP